MRETDHSGHAAIAEAILNLAHVRGQVPLTLGDQRLARRDRPLPLVDLVFTKVEIDAEPGLANAKTLVGLLEVAGAFRQSTLALDQVRLAFVHPRFTALELGE